MRSVVHAHDVPQTQMWSIVVTHDVPQTQMRSVVHARDTPQANFRSVVLTHDTTFPCLQFIAPIRDAQSFSQTHVPIEFLSRMY